jgi:hypothetical protein
MATREPKRRDEAEPDDLESALGVALAFVVYLGIAALALGAGLHRARPVWYVALLLPTVVLGRRMGAVTAGYGGLVAGLFYNFISTGGAGLRYRSWMDLGVLCTFIIVGVAASLIGRPGAHEEREVVVQTPPRPPALDFAHELSSAIGEKSRGQTSSHV